ncbi:sirohydrochlorin chelatase [Aliiroseovarius marinus]|uniref:sirohydrochlorin chelatase n=1 Tax=Aliiroseovarius marinus TaxID=2500159 RepID=UPI003D7D5CDC
MQLADALIVSHGQPSDPIPAENALHRLVEGVQDKMSDTVLSCATMAAPGRLEQALERLKPGGAIYPLFMTDGWFVRTALAGRVASRQGDIMVPFGMDPALPGIAAEQVQESLQSENASLFVVAHGSGSGRSAPARVTRTFSAALGKLLPDARVEVGFLEQDPSIIDMCKKVGKGALCLPYFAMEGEHVRDDVDAALKSGGFTGHVLPVISSFPGVDQMIADAISGYEADHSLLRSAS